MKMKTAGRRWLVAMGFVFAGLVAVPAACAESKGQTTRRTVDLETNCWDLYPRREDVALL
ncbi:MAG: hypothetical protein HUU20_01510 [Pirellulales bacterium]|nr:hypothetical protein [Pirellulales bacterium]